MKWRTNETKWRTNFIALVALRSSTSQKKYSKNVVWLIFGILSHWQRRRERNKTERRKKDNEQLEMEKLLALQIPDLDRKIRFIISCIQFLINFIYFDTSYNLFIFTKLTCLSVLSYESLFLFVNFVLKFNFVFKLTDVKFYLLDVFPKLEKHSCL